MCLMCLMRLMWWTCLMTVFDVFYGIVFDMFAVLNVFDDCV